MESLSHSYEKSINQIQFLKKQINGEKIAHQNTLKQLQSAYQIIDDIKEALRVEQTNNLRLKTEIADKSARISAITNQYQQQISDIKDMITLKDQELKRLSSVLLVSDYDMIRLKVINELQLTHKEEIEKLNNQINRKVVEIAEIRSKQNLLTSKNEHLVEQSKRFNQQRIQEKEHLNKKYMQQIKNLYETVQRQRSQANKWSKKYQILQVKSKKQAEAFKEEISKITKQLQIQNRALMSNTNGKATKIKMEKLEEQYIKIKDELQQEKDNGKKLQDQNARLRKQIKLYKKQENDLKIEKDRLSDQLDQLKRELQNKQYQKLRQIESIKNQYKDKNENQSSLVSYEKQKINKLELQNKRLTFHLQSKDEQILQLKQKNKQNNLHLIRKELEEKTEEIQNLVIQLNNYKKKERAKSIHDKSDASHVKRQLNEANQKIVGLLKQKIELHRQINKYKNESGQS